MADREQPYDPYIPSGGAAQGAQGQNGNMRTAALQAVRYLAHTQKNAYATDAASRGSRIAAAVAEELVSKIQGHDISPAATTKHCEHCSSRVRCIAKTVCLALCSLLFALICACAALPIDIC
jgi:hypothetical protein